MKTSIPKIVGEFRKMMQAFHSTYFLIYTDIDTKTHEILTKTTSNSTPVGITAIFSLLLEPSEEAVQMMIKALPRPSWFASRAKREKQARALLDQLRKMFKLREVEQKPVEQSNVILS